MLKKSEQIQCALLLFFYTKKLKTFLHEHTSLDTDTMAKAYHQRFYETMNALDMGESRGRFSSYLNIFSGLSAYEVLREQGLSHEEGVAAYDQMCRGLRKLGGWMYDCLDRLPHSYPMVRKSILKDLEGPQAICWEAAVVQDDETGFTYEISRCLYFDTCQEHGYPEFCQVFCTHDAYAFGSLHRHTQYIRHSTIAQDGTVCRDSFVKVQ